MVSNAAKAKVVATSDGVEGTSDGVEGVRRRGKQMRLGEDEAIESVRIEEGRTIKWATTRNGGVTRLVNIHVRVMSYVWFKVSAINLSSESCLIL